MKKLVYSKHALAQMAERGATREEAKEAIEKGERAPAKKGRHAYRLNFQYEKLWGGKYYRVKQVMPVVKEEERGICIITVYVFYF